VFGHAVQAHEGVRQADLPLRPGPLGRHGPYYKWGHLKDGKLVHRVVTPEQASLLQQAIDNQRHAKELMRAWEEQTERLIDGSTSLTRAPWGRRLYRSRSDHQSTVRPG
jgi:hypothetical protein